MTRRLIVLPSAEADLSSIWDYTAERLPLEQARAYASGITHLLFLLCDQPEIAPLFGIVSPPVRIHRFRSHLVIFTADASSIEVIRVVHIRSNWAEALAQ